MSMVVGKTPVAGRDYGYVMPITVNVQFDLGTIYTIKSRLNDYVTWAIGGNVFNDWRIDINYATAFPTSTLRIPSFDLVDENYGRKTPEDASWVYYDFSIFIHGKYDITGGSTPDAKDAMDNGDVMLDYLVGIRGNESEKSRFGIYWIDEILINVETKDRRPRDIRTVSVRGRIKAKLLDE